MQKIRHEKHKVLFLKIFSFIERSKKNATYKIANMTTL